MDMKLINKGTEGEFMLSGRLDANSAPEAEAVLKENSARFDKLTLNLAGLVYISSAGLRVLKVMHVTMQKKGGALVLKNTNRKVMEVLEMTGFAGHLQFE